jgi:hypothetical protein
MLFAFSRDDFLTYRATSNFERCEEIGVLADFGFEFAVLVGGVGDSLAEFAGFESEFSMMRQAPLI